MTENLALSGHTWQQHPFPPERSYFVSENAVDDLYEDRSPFGNQCTISDNYRYTAEWRVDLRSVVSISHVNIFHRTDNLPSMNILLSLKAWWIKLSILKIIYWNIMFLTKLKTLHKSNLVNISHSNIFYKTDNSPNRNMGFPTEKSSYQNGRCAAAKSVPSLYG